MKVVTDIRKRKAVDFEDLDEGDTFIEGESGQIQIKTDNEDGVCLESGETTSYDGEDNVIPVTCEVHVIG